LKLVITIDTEEDNWGSFSPTEYTLKNIGRIPALQDLFDEFRIKPTYLLTYPVATDQKATAMLKQIVLDDRCEIGAHCHPWNTPPFVEETNEKNSMLYNLPEELQYEKLLALYQTIQRNFDVTPVSFRSGRWGYGASVAKNLSRLGNIIDTSILPYEDWSNHYGPDFSTISSRPFRFSADDIFREWKEGPMMEIPATVDYLQENFGLSNKVLLMLKQKHLKKLRLVGLFSRLQMLNKVWLSPEVSDSKDMIQLTRCMMRKKCKVINMFFHSSTLHEGMTPYVRTKSDEQRFLGTIKEFLAFIKSEGIESLKLKDCVTEL
jgi:hypothetical protein